MKNVPLQYIEYGFGYKYSNKIPIYPIFGYIVIRSPYTPYSIYLQGDDGDYRDPEFARQETKGPPGGKRALRVTWAARQE